MKAVKIDEAKITSQGQVSIPVKVREKLHIQRGDRVVFLEDGVGRIIIEQVEAPIELTEEGWKEFLAKSEKEPVTRVRGKEEALRHLDKLTKKK